MLSKLFISRISRCTGYQNCSLSSLSRITGFESESKAEQTYKFKNIPVGTYVCNYMWTDSRGKRHFNKDNSTMPFKPNEVGGYVITMEKTVNGNLSQSSISEDEFFN